MAELEWRSIPGADHRWSAALPRAFSAPHADVTALALAAAEPNRLPSGINGFWLNRDDHIALIVLPGAPDAYFDVILDFVSAGIDDQTRSEYLSLELTEGRSAAEASSCLRHRIGRELPGTVDIRDWERNSADYQPQHFDRPGMWHAMQGERERLKDSPGALLRVASEDCSAFMAWLSNPADYVAYEHELAADLGRHLVDRPFVQLCTFKVSTLAEIAAQGHFDLDTTLLDLALSHNRVLLLDADGLHVDGSATRRLLRATWPPRSVASWRRWAAVARRFVARRSSELVRG